MQEGFPDGKPTFMAALPPIHVPVGTIHVLWTIHGAKRDFIGAVKCIIAAPLSVAHMQNFCYTVI